MRMTKLITALAVLSLVLFGWNCKDDEETPVIPEKYVGTWKANVNLEGTLIQYAPVSDPESGVDVRFLGAAITVTLNKDGTFTLIFVEPGAGQEEDAGTVALDEDLNILVLNSNNPLGEDLIFAYEWDGDNTIILTTETDFDYDLDGPNPPVPSIVTVILKRS